MVYERLSAKNKKIWKMLLEGCSVKDISKKVRCPAKDVYSMRYRMKQEGVLNKNNAPIKKDAVKQTQVKKEPTIQTTPVVPQEITTVIVTKESMWQRIKDFVSSLTRM